MVAGKKAISIVVQFHAINRQDTASSCLRATHLGLQDIGLKRHEGYRDLTVWILSCVD